MTTDLTIQPDEIDWRIGATYDGRDGKMGMLLGYIDARLAMDKLDALDPNWSSHIEVMRLGDRDGVRCSLTVNGVTREDVGTASDTEPLKGAVSDALKRAAVHFGIGRELYDLPTISVQVEVKANGKVGKPKALPIWKDGKWTIDSKYGWVKYDHEPIEQPPAAGPGRGASPSRDTGPVPAPVTYRRSELIALMAEKGMDYKAAEEYATLIGIPLTERPMLDASMDRLIAAIAGHGTEAPLELGLGPTEPPAAPSEPAETRKRSRTTAEAIADAEQKARV